MSSARSPGPQPATDEVTELSSQNLQPGVNVLTDLNQVSYKHTTDFGFLPIPTYLRYNPDKPFYFGTALNIAFGFASTFTAANLYYCQPLLIQFSQSFHASYNDVSKIPTLTQAGYAAGILLISPLGDLVRRRQLILCVLTICSALTIGLAVTSNLIVFETLSFLIGMLTVTPQILLPLVADIAPPQRRASAISVVLSGLLFGILIARVISGVIAEFTSWRVVYYFAIGVQFFVLFGCYLLLPDYPSKNKDLTYWKILWTMAKFSVTEPLLIQQCLINLGSSACFSCFWVTLTFLLGGPPYFYSTLVIGLFGLLGMAGVATSPIGGQIVDKFTPWYSSLFSILMLLCFQAIQVGAGGINVGAVIVVTFGLDVFRQMLQVSVSTTIFGISAEARARLNAVGLLSVFIGQVMGTAVGTKVFLKFGWRACAALQMGWYGWMLCTLLVRGPHCKRYTWFGYEGGWEPRKSVIESKDLNAEPKASSSEEKVGGAQDSTDVVEHAPHAPETEV